MTRPVLDRRVEFDERSRNYPIRRLLGLEALLPPRSYSWRVPVTLDQGSEGACVGFSWAQELAARPVVVDGVTEVTARSIYRRARELDEWPGEDYEGTSVLAGAKAVAEKGFLSEYRWAFGLDDLILAVGRHGPAVLGINWYEGMFSPEPDGRVRPGGPVAGGHAIIAYSVNVRQGIIRLWNSWGSAWWPGGAWCYLTFEDMARLLSEDGEACVPVHRAKGAF